MRTGNSQPGELNITTSLMITNEHVSCVFGLCRKRNVKTTVCTFTGSYHESIIETRYQDQRLKMACLAHEPKQFSSLQFCLLISVSRAGTANRFSAQPIDFTLG